MEDGFLEIIGFWSAYCPQGRGGFWLWDFRVYWME